MFHYFQRLLQPLGELKVIVLSIPHFISNNKQFELTLRIHNTT